MFFYDREWSRRFLHVDHKDLDDVKMWAFCIGAHNLIAGVGMLVGLWILHNGDAEVGRTVVLTTAWYMLLASLAMGVSDLLGHWRPRGGSAMGTIASSAPPILVIIAAAIGRALLCADRRYVHEFLCDVHRRRPGLAREYAALSPMCLPFSPD